ncbi:hypothetical protein ROZALSC1DRAFT_31531 [Rozella allomycis CSF55]|uniref:Protein kinase domain-containing protein n=1 Tax=Rozella allomycis (strain CSF55) TaxID=988480 RepID=A0A4P9YBA5_ROZAC|nr:hypothetical protein ROZALSC1DRAFT_31531 [Rozella allomycis CSF55]
MSFKKHVLVFEYLKGVPIYQHVTLQRVSLGNQIEIAMKILIFLEELRNFGIVLNNINIYNIFIDEGSVKFINMEYSTNINEAKLFPSVNIISANETENTHAIDYFGFGVAIYMIQALICCSDATKDNFLEMILPFKQVSNNLIPLPCPDSFNYNIYRFTRPFLQIDHRKRVGHSLKSFELIEFNLFKGLNWRDMKQNMHYTTNYQSIELEFGKQNPRNFDFDMGYVNRYIHLLHQQTILIDQLRGFDCIQALKTLFSKVTEKCELTLNSINNYNQFMISSLECMRLLSVNCEVFRNELDILLKHVDSKLLESKVLLQESLRVKKQVESISNDKTNTIKAIENINFNLSLLKDFIIKSTQIAF